MLCKEIDVLQYNILEKQQSIDVLQKRIDVLQPNVLELQLHVESH